ncbi:MAG: DUF2461 domain-containing protein [Bacteroidales bacterium]|nr:DUF2461 domain-containing protein [Bacteroidales bacterium]
MDKQVLDFLSQLEKNNNREWFQQNKQQYNEAKAEMESFVASVITDLAKFDDSIKYVEAKDCMFRIFRDVRFAADKSPYKINMGAWISQAGRKSAGPGYYIHLQPGGSFLAAGVYMPEPDQLKKIRNEIYYNITEFKSILSEKKLRKNSVGLSDHDKGKMAPRDFPKDFPDIDLLKYKHYTLSQPLRDEMVASDHFQEIAVMTFKVMYPFNLFLKRALDV